MLTDEQKGDLLRVIRHWAKASKELPAGIYALRNALHDDLALDFSSRKAHKGLTIRPRGSPAHRSLSTENPARAGLSMERMKGLEPSTFCMASRCSTN
jgi:hypothetical protein